MKTVNIYEKDFKITDSNEEPSNINLDAYPFFKERIFNSPGTVDNGRIKEIKHWRNYDGVTYSDLIVKEDIVYVDINNFLAYKNINITYYMEDDSIGVIQSKTKIFGGNQGMLESIEEGEIRRKYLIKTGKLYLLGTIGIAAGIALFATLKNEIQEYEGVNNQTSLFTSINASSLTGEQKQTLIHLLTY